MTVEEDGGNLDFNVSNTGPKADLSGLFFDFTNKKLAGLAVSGDPQITQFVTGAGSVINLKNGVNLNGAKLNGSNVSPFDVGMEFGLAGIGSNHQNLQTAVFVLSDAAHDLTLNDLRPAGETGQVGVRDLSSGQKLVGIAPYAPTATPDTVTTPEDVSIVIPVSALATDKNAGGTLTIDEIGAGAQGPQYGTVTVSADRKSLIYNPTNLDWIVDGILTGNQDAFQVCVKDSLGGEVTSFVTVNSTPVADVPTVAEGVAPPHPGDLASLFRFAVTVTSGDYGTIDQFSDFIKSLALSLTGTNTAGISITDSLGLLAGGVITPPANPGLFTDEIDVSLPTGATFNDKLTMTGVNAETEAPNVTASKTVSQTITADTVTTLEDQSATLSISNLVSAPNMKITGLGVGPKYGTVSIAADGQSLTYTPTTLDYMVHGVLTGDQDVFQVYSTDGAGNNAVTLVTIKQTPVADKPTLVIDSVTSGATVDDMLITFTLSAGDFGSVQQGSDYLQSLGLSLAGNDTGGVIVSDSLGLLNTGTDTFNLSGSSQSITDTVDVKTPSIAAVGPTPSSPVDIADNLSLTAVNAETEGFGSPATASASVSQAINVDYSQAQETPTFTTDNQSIWDTGNAFNFDFNKFLGVGSTGGVPLKLGPHTIGGTELGTGATGRGSLSLKAGFQVDLNINGGTFDASLPFNVTLNDTYNKTTDTLEVSESDSAGNGSLTTSGPGGGFDLEAIFSAMASVGAHIYAIGGSIGTTISVGPFSGSTTLVKVNSGSPPDVIKFGGVNLTFAFPNLSTSGNGASTSISTSTPGGQGTVFNIGVDIIQVILESLFGDDPLKGSFAGIGYTLVGVAFAALGLKQTFTLSDLGITPELLVGTSKTAELFNQPIHNVSSLGLNPDGSVPLALSFSLNDPTLKNQTGLSITAGAGLTIGKISGVGTLANPHITVPLGSVPIFSPTFNVAGFQTQTAQVDVA